MAEMPESQPESSGRKSREYGKDASSGTARKEPVRPEDLQMMEAVVARENLLNAYSRVMSNKGAAGIDGMSVEELKPYQQEHWVKIKQDLLKGTYQPQAVRCVEIPILVTLRGRPGIRLGSYLKYSVKTHCGHT